MTLRLLPLLLLTGCTVFNGYFVMGGVPDVTDLDCGKVEGQSVRVTYQAHYLVTCEEARAAVAHELAETHLHQEWTVMVGLDSGCSEWKVVSSYDGWGARAGQTLAVVPLHGCTYPGRHVVALVGLKEEIIAHEFGHAQDMELGRPNTRDPKNRWVASNEEEKPEVQREDVYQRDDGTVLEIRRGIQ